MEADSTIRKAELYSGIFKRCVNSTLSLITHIHCYIKTVYSFIHHLYKKLYINILQLLKNSLHRRNINEESNRVTETKNKMFNPPA